jgi:hypothetical protein
MQDLQRASTAEFPLCKTVCAATIAPDSRCTVQSADGNAHALGNAAGAGR